MSRLISLRNSLVSRVINSTRVINSIDDNWVLCRIPLTLIERTLPFESVFPDFAGITLFDTPLWTNHVEIEVRGTTRKTLSGVAVYLCTDILDLIPESRVELVFVLVDEF